MNELSSRLLAGADQLGAIVPSLIAAGLILLTGYFLARQVEKWTDHLLRRMDFNKVAAAGGLAEAVDRAGVRLDPAHAIGKLLFWLVMLVVILLSSMALGLESIHQMFGIMLSYIPTLIAGVIIVILGMIVGEFVRALVLASAGTVEGVPTLAKLAKVAVIVISIFMALQQIGVADEIVTSAFTLILGAVALGAGLAFGLGNRELAGEITRRWYERGRQARSRPAAPGEAGDPPTGGEGPSAG
jgi:small-conductance mechanosensitive channel